MPTILLFTIGLFVTLINLASAIPTISAVGAKFFTSDGNQFFIKGAQTLNFQRTAYLEVQKLIRPSLRTGVAYQLTSKDPLIDTNQCQLDASLMKTLGANAIRVYHVDPSQDHQGCMSAFADAGVYLFVDLDDFPTQIVGVRNLVTCPFRFCPKLTRLRTRRVPRRGTSLKPLHSRKCWMNSRNTITPLGSWLETKSSPPVCDSEASQMFESRADDSDSQCLLCCSLCPGSSP